MGTLLAINGFYLFGYFCFSAAGYIANKQKLLGKIKQRFIKDIVLIGLAGLLLLQLYLHMGSMSSLINIDLATKDIIPQDSLLPTLLGAHFSTLLLMIKSDQYIEH